MTGKQPRRAHVLVAYKSLPQYRVDFFDALRRRLETEDISLDLIYGDATGPSAARRDTATLPWATYRPNRVLPIADREFIWQPCLRRSRHFDLVIVEQASRLLLNYALLLRQGIGMARVAFWGHGANLQAHRSLALAEAVKKRVSRRPHWWFAYTEGSRHRVRELGYPAERITVVQNAIDTGKLRSARERLGESAAVDTRVRLGLGNGPVAAFVGGLYEDKRLEFLLQVADRLALARPGFHLVVVGDGPLRQTIEREASRRPHVTYCGALFGDEKVAALAPASALLLPGLVGLAILDAFALEIPLVTANVDFHSPEIEYLIDGENGLMVSAANDVQAYVSAVLRVFDDASLSHRLQEGCRAAACRYTNEEMVERFSGGVIQALKAQ